MDYAHIAACISVCRICKLGADARLVQAYKYGRRNLDDIGEFAATSQAASSQARLSPLWTVSCHSNRAQHWPATSAMLGVNILRLY